MSYSLRLIPLLPFLGAAFLFLFGRALRRDWVHLAATGQRENSRILLVRIREGLVPPSPAEQPCYPDTRYRTEHPVSD